MEITAVFFDHYLPKSCQPRVTLLLIDLHTKHRHLCKTDIISYVYLKQTQHCKVLDYFYLLHFGTILTAI